MTLGNRREPSFDGAHQSSQSGAHEGLHIGSLDQKAHAATRASGLTRVVSSVQIIGSLLAVPLGLASGYTMYRTTFAVDATCQNLRGNIIAMLDKNVDASTRRMLVRRDIDTFEQTCGGIDPDAHAAFKALLAPLPAAAAPKLRAALPAADVARKAEPKAETAKADVKPVPKVEAKAEAKAEPKTESKPEPRPAVAEKQPAAVVAAAPPVDAEAAQRESDMRWLASVRQALVTHGPEKAEAAAEPAKVEPTLAKPARIDTLAVVKPAQPPVQLQPAWNVPAPVVAGTPAVEPPAPARTSDHPVPPALIPGTALAPTPVNGETDGEPQVRSRIGSWIAQIPLVGRVIERGN